MPLERGTKLGPYQIESPLGAGGMGEVYKATDTRLERTVAIKVLPAHVASDPERKQRFEREAKTVAALSHPHICPVFDVGREGEIGFLVMEYLEGETLADRLSKGALPLDQALRYAIEIADALDKAHRQGVTHRDLKPANIMLTKAGAKLLDFGLAKLKPTGPQSDASTRLDESLTEQGTILGTFQYMSPEQLNGEDADGRTDIFAFGAVLYEMATGRKAFEAKTQASLIAAILERVPPAMSSLEPMTPAGLDYIAKTCLGKDPDDRWQTARDLLRELKRVEAGGAAPADSAPTIAQQRLAVWQRPIPALLTVVAVAAVSGLAVWSVTGPSTPSPLTRYAVTLPDTDSLGPVGGGPVGVALSPDGGQFVYSASRDGTIQLFLRAREQVEAVSIRGTEGAMFPFFSPDGQWVGFFTGEALMKVSLAGGPPVTLCETDGRRGASWGPDDTIVFASNSQPGLMLVSASGGEPRPLTTPEDGERHIWPAFLPGGRALVYTARSGANVANVPETGRVMLLDLATGEATELTQGTSPRFAETGHLVFAREASLWAVPFDLEQLALTGEPAPVVEGVAVAGGGLAYYDLAGDGSLAYRVGTDTSGSDSLVSVDRNGQPTLLTDDRRTYGEVRVSPDGNRIAVEVPGGGATEVWIFDVTRGTLTRLTVGGGQDPVWTPDGTRITFRGPDDNLYWKAADGSDEAERLTTSDIPQTPRSWSPDGQVLAFVEGIGGRAAGDLWMLPQDDAPSAFLSTPFDEESPEFSPDGRWLAYLSDESGQDEVYVQPYPGPGGRVQISTAGGLAPTWSRDGRELFYREPPNADVMVVSVDTESALVVGQPRVLFGGPYRATGGPSRFFDLFPDGERLVMVQIGSASGREEFHVVENWFQELERLVPTP